MKMERSVLCACTFLVVSVVLNGCDFGESPRKVEKSVEKSVSKAASVIEDDVEAALPKPPTRKTAAKCHGGHFHCDGGWKEWCDRMKKQCKPKDCAPMCSWTCDSPQCNKECGPKCNQPACSTRCKGFNTDSCKMKCGKPMCKVVCPKHFCPSEDCAACKTECGKPACKMECGVDEQPCRHVCAQPVCQWECKDPQLCPKPKCEMKCKKQPDCMQKMHMFSKVSPLEPGETEIVTMDSPGPSPAPASASFLQGGQVSKLRVNFTSMGEDHSMHKGQVELAMIQEDMAAMDSDTWTREVTEVHGQVMESEASCTNGHFHCQGDAVWCATQEKLLCPGGQFVFRQRPHMQGHLQA